LDGQGLFDGLVSATNCTGASDRLACLRAVPYADLMTAINHFPLSVGSQDLVLAFPMVDGKLLQSNPLELVQSGKYAKVLHTELFIYFKTSSVSQVPFIAGTCEDEGT
jgi:acetylcholinesterase